MATIPVRAYAELMSLPAYEQVRLLHDYKYPRQQPQKFKIPYYQTALTGIKKYYRSGNNPAVLAAARATAKQLRPASRLTHNLRVLGQFQASSQANRSLSPQTSNTFSASLGAIDLRLRFDLVAAEGKAVRRVLYNLRTAQIDAETARDSLEIAHWVLAKNHINVPLTVLEYVDIPSGYTHRFATVRASTIRRMQQNAAIIGTLWPTI